MAIKNFDDKLVFITGGSSGIGLETAKQLTEKGARVVIFGRSQQKLDDALKEIGNRGAAFSLDVTNDALVREVVANACETCGVPDILINCAGRAVPHYFEDITFDMFDATMRTNLYGQWSMCAALVPAMKKRGGHIVNVSSVAGFLGVFGYSDYTASKYASVGFSEVLKSELRQYNIGVSVLCPPDTDTPGFEEENMTKPFETNAISEGGGLLLPSEVASDLLKGILKQRFIIIPGYQGKLIYLMKRFMPVLLRKIVDASVRKAQKSKARAAEHL